VRIPKKEVGRSWTSFSISSSCLRRLVGNVAVEQ
jgi:hypothetical protein